MCFSVRSSSAVPVNRHGLVRCPYVGHGRLRERGRSRWRSERETRRHEGRGITGGTPEVFGISFGAPRATRTWRPGYQDVSYRGPEPGVLSPPVRLAPSPRASPFLLATFTVYHITYFF